MATIANLELRITAGLAVQPEMTLDEMDAWQASHPEVSDIVLYDYDCARFSPERNVGITAVVAGPPVVRIDVRGRSFRECIQRIEGER